MEASFTGIATHLTRPLTDVQKFCSYSGYLSDVVSDIYLSYVQILQSCIGYSGLPCLLKWHGAHCLCSCSWTWIENAHWIYTPCALDSPPVIFARQQRACRSRGKALDATSPDWGQPGTNPGQGRCICLSRGAEVSSTTRLPPQLNQLKNGPDGHLGNDVVMRGSVMNALIRGIRSRTDNSG